jgi:acyl-CoA synthetase (AMP-forming)/AMP-acid ligase II
LVQLEAVDAIARQIDPSVECCAVALPSAYWGTVIALMVAGQADKFQLALADTFEQHGRQMRPRLVLEVK